MILKEFKKNHKPKKFYNFLLLYFISTIFIGVTLFILFLNLGFTQDHKRKFIERIHMNGIYNYKYIPNILYLIIKNPISKFDTFNLNISQKNILILEENRNKKLSNPNTKFKSARAEILYKDKVLKTDIRLKGDRSIHYEKRKNSSYRFNLDRDNFYDTMKSFSLQKPRIRNYVHEWIFHELSKDMGLIKLKYDFVHLKINGKKKGLYVVEESFSNSLLERNIKREGPIFGLEEYYYDNNFEEGPRLDVYQESFWLRPENEKLYFVAKKKLLALKNKEIPLNKVVDINKWSMYFAICELLGTFHGAAAKSVKFYYNPISGLFEPIPFDGHKMPAFDYHESIKDIWVNEMIVRNGPLSSVWDRSQEEGSFLSLFFFDKNKDLNKEFFKSYLDSVDTITNKEFIDNFFEKNQKKIDQINTQIYLDGAKFDYNSRRKSGIGIYYFDKSYIYKNAEFLKKNYSPDFRSLYSEYLGDNIFINNLDLKNTQLFVKNIECDLKVNGTLIRKKIDLDYQVKIGQNYIKVKDIFLKNFSKDHILKRCDYILLQNAVSKETTIQKIKQNIRVRKKQKNNDLYLQYFVIVKDKLFLKQNEISIDQNIYIPPKYVVEIKNNQKIKLVNNAFIFSDSPWKAKSKKKNGIEISGDPNNFGGGIIISNSKNNIFNNVNIQYLRGLDFSNNFKSINSFGQSGFIKTSLNSKKENFYSNIFVEDKSYDNLELGYKIYGALNFYNSEVKLLNVKFSNITSEDALNIIESDFEIDNNSFENIKSDAIDIDSGTGNILNSFFLNISNDAIDLSGSKVKVENINAKNILDKVISSGENSLSSISNLNIKNAFVGIANKDGSKVFLNDSVFVNVEVPIAAYLKKKNFNESTMIVKNTMIEKSKINYLVSNKQNLTINNIKKKDYLDNKTILEIIYRQDKEKLK